MFRWIKETARIFSTKPVEPEVKTYSRVVLYSENGGRLLDVLTLSLPKCFAWNKLAVSK